MADDVHADGGSGWYWDLSRKVAVRAADRGPAGDLLGPYPSRAEAENWQRRVDDRNDEWDDADDEWDERGEADD